MALPQFTIKTKTAVLPRNPQDAIDDAQLEAEARVVEVEREAEARVAEARAQSDRELDGRLRAAEEQMKRTVRLQTSAQPSPCGAAENPQKTCQQLISRSALRARAAGVRSRCGCLLLLLLFFACSDLTKETARRRGSARCSRRAPPTASRSWSSSWARPAQHTRSAFAPCSVQRALLISPPVKRR